MRQILHEQEHHHGGNGTAGYVGLYRLTVPPGRTYTVRVELKKDSYDFQSYGRVQVWSWQQNRWEFLAYIPSPLLNICLPQKTYKERTNFFQTDIESLLHQAELILGDES